MSSGPIHPDFKGSAPDAGEGVTDPQPQPGNTDQAGESPTLEDVVRENEQLKKRYADSSTEAQRLVQQLNSQGEQIRTLNAVVTAPQVQAASDQRREAIAALEAAGIPTDLLRSVMADVATETVGATLEPILNAAQASKNLGAEAQAIAETLTAAPAMYETYTAMVATDPVAAERFAREFHRIQTDATPQAAAAALPDGEQAAIAQDAQIRVDRQTRKVQGQVVTPQSTSRTSTAASAGVGGYSPVESETMQQLYNRVLDGDQTAVREYARLRLFGGEDPVIPQEHLDGGFVKARPITNQR